MQVLVLPDSYFGEEVWEPQYPSEGLAKKPHPDARMIYRGHDFGGHNIPFPHPAPPKPYKMYDPNSYIDLTNYVIGSRQASKVEESEEARK